MYVIAHVYMCYGLCVRLYICLCICAQVLCARAWRVSVYVLWFMMVVVEITGGNGDDNNDDDNSKTNNVSNDVANGNRNSCSCQPPPGS